MAWILLEAVVSLVLALLVFGALYYRLTTRRKHKATSEQLAHHLQLLG
jgi:hypothetical protein